MKGRKPQAPPLRLLSGETRPSKINLDAPMPPVEIPEPPLFLSDAALEKWNEITPQLAAMGVIARMDSSALAGLCLAYARMLKAEKEADEAGLTYVSEGGLVKRHPASAIAHEASRDFLAYLQEFGLTPSARSRVKAAPGGDEGNARDKKLFGA